jgi:hypothetical protein
VLCASSGRFALPQGSPFAEPRPTPALRAGTAGLRAVGVLPSAAGGGRTQPEAKALSIPCELTFDPVSGELRTLCSLDALTRLFGQALGRQSPPSAPEPPAEAASPATPAAQP